MGLDITLHPRTSSENAAWMPYPRAGLHTSEVEVREKGLAGIALHVAARVASLAGAEEVLVSSTVKDLVVGSGIAFADRGRHQLKRVPEEWHLFSVEQSCQGRSG